MKSYAAIKSQIASLEKQAAELRQKEVAQVVARIRSEIGTYGLTAHDLGLNRLGKGAKPSGASKAVQAGIPRYRDPASGKTWTGRGKPPAWIAGASDRSAFLIKGGNASGVGTAKAQGAQKTGGGVPKYRDPASGKTWTGRGKPPAWIAGAADRSAFLIDGGGAARRSVKPQKQVKAKATRAASAKKPAQAAKSSAAKRAAQKKPAAQRRSPQAKAGRPSVKKRMAATAARKGTSRGASPTPAQQAVASSEQGAAQS